MWCRPVDPPGSAGSESGRRASRANQITAFIPRDGHFALILVGSIPARGLPPQLGAIAASLASCRISRASAAGWIDLRDAVYFVTPRHLFLVFAYFACCP